MSFRENLVTLRKNKGYSARSFADKLNIPYTTYLAYEKSDREPKYSLLIEIANLLNVSLDELIRPRLPNASVKPLNLFMGI